MTKLLPLKLLDLRKIGDWKLTARLEPQQALYYALASGLLMLSCVAWITRQTWFAVPFTACFTLLAWALARDLEEGKPAAPRGAALLILGLAAQLPASIAMTPLMNPLVTYALGTALWAIVTHSRLHRWWVKAPALMIAAMVGILTTPLLYGIWLPLLYGWVQRLTPNKRWSALLLSSVMLMPLAQWAWAWVGIIAASTLIYSLEGQHQATAPLLKHAKHLNFSYIAAIATLAATFFAFPIALYLGAK